MAAVFGFFEVLLRSTRLCPYIGCSKVVLVLLSSDFHHLQSPSKLEVVEYRGFTIKKVLTVVRIVATAVFLS